MNRGLLAKSFRENWPVTLALGAFMLLAATAIAFVSRQINASQFNAVLKSGFVRDVISGMVGTMVTAEMGRQLVQTLPWVHPLTTIILFAHMIAIGTQLPAGEIDRGTIDVLMSLPISRRQAYFCHALIWFFSGLVMMTALLAGNWCGAHLAHDSLAPGKIIAFVFINAFSIYLASGGLCFLVSSACSRRGRAVAVIIGFIVVFTLMNAVADLWTPARFLNNFTPINYFRPIFVFLQGAMPWGNVAVLLIAGALCWIAGAIVFERRDLHVG